MKLKEGKISSGDLANTLHMSPQALSYHLTKLKKADLIYETHYKNFIYYELNLSILDETILWIENLKGEKNEDKEDYIIYSNVFTFTLYCSSSTNFARPDTCTL